VSSLYLSRIRLRDDASVAALAGLLLPAGEDQGAAAAHKLLWSIFADGPERARDFLWRDDGGTRWRRRTFLALSQRLPEDRARLFEIETKPFEPALRAGQHLRFRLRASPSANVRVPGGKRGKRVDPVALALSKVPRAEWAERRYDVLQQVGRDWLAAQGARSGFHLPEHGLAVDGEDWRSLPRGGGAPITFSVLDLEGIIEVTDPDLFQPALARGFGRAKAFGCGLMLIRPA